MHTTRRLQQFAISCKRSDYNKSQKSCQHSTLSILMSERPKQVSLFFDATDFTSSEVIDILEFMSCTSVHSTATMRYWMKRTNATFGIDEKGWVQVVLLQIHGGDGSQL